MRVGIGAAAGLLAAAITMAGCSNDGAEPSTLPDTTVSVSASPTESSAATATGDPTAQLEAEITEFFEEYAQVINDSWQSPDALQRRREMFVDSCDSCLAGYNLADQAQAQGLRYEGGEAALQRLEVDRIANEVVTVSAFTTSERGRLVDKDNNVVQEFDAASDVQIVYQLRRADSASWIIISDEVLN